ncbi:MAG: hypothetical protein FVQ81_01960 [Candidatus Glassbacteria bacterium]|nr:hypothetical protein [Candidatus Glassbacteria bacterium]
MSKVEKFRRDIEDRYAQHPTGGGGSFGEIICFELHSQPVNPRMTCRSSTGFSTGLTFRELAEKWGVSVSFLGELIADHCAKLD